MEKKTITKLAAVLLFFITVLLGYFWNDVQEYINSRIHPLPDVVVLTENGNSPLSPPKGYSVQIFASRLDQPRTLLIDPMDRVIAAIAGEGTIRVFTDAEQDTQSTVLLSDLNRPHGLALTCTDTCKLAIAESNKVTIWDYDPDSVSITSPQQIDNLDDSGTHYAKGVIFDPKNPNILYIFSGSTCNVCHETTPGRAAIQKVDVSEEPLEVTLFASGLRNSLFGAINPSTQEIWMTEISRDFLDGGLPPDEINILSAGNNYGWPQCYGNNVHDRDFDNNLYQLPKGMSICESYNAIPPHIELPAHVSPMGIVFTDASATLAKEYPYDALVAYHEGNGQPKIIKLDLDQAGNLEKIEDFISGWQKEGIVYGKPVGIALASNGTIYVSDDQAGAIYKFSPSTNQTLTKNCIITGCSGQICSDQEVMTTCEYRETYGCYDQASCEYNEITDQCEWTMTPELSQCLQNTNTE